MKLHKIASTAVMLGWLLIFGPQTSAVAGESNQVKRVARANSITTKFVDNAQLTPNEVKQVLELAKKCGINHPSEVRTFNWLPGGGRGISVKSIESVDGRNTSFDTVTISKKGWDQSEPETNSVHIGKFWAAIDAKYSTLLRSFKFRKATIQMSIDKEVDTALADLVISLIDAKKVRFENDFIRRDFEELKDSKPVAMHKSSISKGYELRFDEPSMRAIIFDVNNKQVIITGVAHICI